MTTGFVKLFSTILDSSVWSEELHVRIVWITMLAMADRNGRVDAAVSGVARRACVTREQAVEAIARLESPDFDSRTPDNDGRRLAKTDGGWHILNYKKYRQLGAEEAERARKREWWAEHKAGSASAASGRETPLAAASPMPLLLLSASDSGSVSDPDPPDRLDQGSEQASGSTDALVPCPGDLHLTTDQRATVEMHLPGWAVDILTTKFVAKSQASPGDRRSREHWLKGLAVAVVGDWNNPRTRPKQVDADGPQGIAYEDVAPR